MGIGERVTVTQFRDTAWSFQTDADGNIIRNSEGVPVGIVDVQLFNADGMRIAGDHIAVELSEGEAAALEAKFAARRAAYTTATGWMHFPPPEPEGE